MCKYTVRGWHCRIKVVLLCLICKICKSHCVCLVCGARRLPLGQPSGTRCQRTRALSKNLTKKPVCSQRLSLPLYFYHVAWSHTTAFLPECFLPVFTFPARLVEIVTTSAQRTHSHTDTLCECSKYCDFWISTQYLSQSLCPCVASCSQ